MPETGSILTFFIHIDFGVNAMRLCSFLSQPLFNSTFSAALVCLFSLIISRPTFAQDAELRRAYAYTWGTGYFAPSVSHTPVYSFDGPLFVPSPRFFAPGFGYTGGSLSFRPGSNYYLPLSEFWMTSRQFSYSTDFGGSLLLPSGGPMSRYGLDLWSTGAGTLHAPWYLPGSPGNYR